MARFQALSKPLNVVCAPSTSRARLKVGTTAPNLIETSVSGNLVQLRGLHLDLGPFLASCFILISFHGDVAAHWKLPEVAIMLW